MLELRKVSYCPGRHPVVDEVDLSLPRGSITALLGPMGAGTRALLRLLAGELAPTNGRLSLDGRELCSYPRARAADVRVACDRQRGTREAAAVERALDAAGSTRLAVRECDDGHLGGSTRLILIDEAAEVRDVRHPYDLLFLLQRMADTGATVIAALRDVHDAALLADRVVLMHRGQVVADGLPEFVLNPTLIRNVYAVPCALGRAPSPSRLKGGT